MTASTEPQFPPGFDARRVRELIAEGRAESEALARAIPSLLAEHEGELVAGYRGQYVFGNSVDAVVELAKNAGWPLDVVAIRCVERKRPTVLL